MKRSNRMYIGCCNMEKTYQIQGRKIFRRCCMLILIKLTRRAINFPPPKRYFATDDETGRGNENHVFDNRSTIFVHASYSIDGYAQG